MKKISIPAEQGDVTLIQAEIPAALLSNAKKRKSQKGRVILAYGEATGHHHSLDAKKSFVLEANDDLRKLFNAQVGIPPQANILDGVLVVEKDDVLEHQEHNHIAISKNIHWIVIEQEYTPGRIQRTLD